MLIADFPFCVKNEEMAGIVQDRREGCPQKARDCRHWGSISIPKLINWAGEAQSEQISIKTHQCSTFVVWDQFQWPNAAHMSEKKCKVERRNIEINCTCNLAGCSKAWKVRRQCPDQTWEGKMGLQECFRYVLRVCNITYDHTLFWDPSKLNVLTL